MYFVITPGDKSGPHVECLTKEELLAMLGSDKDYSGGRFLDHTPATYPDDEWYTVNGEATLIIKGEIVTPTPKTVVQTYEIK